jgi:DNA polymerase V
MNSSDDFGDGVPVGRDGPAAPTVRRTSNAFGSPGTDSTVRRLDLNDLLVRHQEATFMMRAAGNAMHDAGIADGDFLVVDRSLTARHGSTVIAAVEGEYRCRRLEQSAMRGGGAGPVSLVATDPAVAPIEISGDVPLEIFGVVTFVIKPLL